MEASLGGLEAAPSQEWKVESLPPDSHFPPSRKVPGEERRRGSVEWTGLHSLASCCSPHFSTAAAAAGSV